MSRKRRNVKRNDARAAQVEDVSPAQEKTGEGSREKTSAAKPYTIEELQALCETEIEDSQVDDVLLGVTSSINEEIGLQDDRAIAAYRKLLGTLPIRAYQVVLDVFVAIASCRRAKAPATLIDLLNGLRRSLAVDRINHFSYGDFIFLMEGDHTPDVLVAIHGLLEENRMAGLRRPHLSIIDAKVVVEMLDKPTGFESVEDLLSRPGDVDQTDEASIYQARLMVEILFSRKRHLIQPNARNLCLLIDSLGYCPPKAIDSIFVMAETCLEMMKNRQKSTSFHILLLTLVKNLDLTSRKVTSQLLIVIKMLAELKSLGPIMFRKTLSVFAELYQNSNCSEDQERIQGLIMEQVTRITEAEKDLQCQLFLVDFFETLKHKTDVAPNRTICTALIKNSAGLSVLGRLCSLMLSDNQYEADENIRLIIDDKVSKRNMSKEELKVEFPSIYRILRGGLS